jgi:hypothetical protein
VADQPFVPHAASIIALALVLLPVVLLLGIATYVRLVQINNEDLDLVMAMNRLRHAYLKIEPGPEPYFTTGHHDDERGLLALQAVEAPRAALVAGGVVAFLALWGALEPEAGR